MTETPKKPRGTVSVQTEVCKGCAYCIEFCPTKSLEFSKEFNRKGYHYPVLARPETYLVGGGRDPSIPRL